MAASNSKEEGNPVYVIQAGDAKQQQKKAVLFEDALDMTGIGRYTYVLFALSILLLWAMALDIFGTSFVVTSSQCDLRLTTTTKGLVGALPMLGIIVSAYMWGYVADTRGRRTTLLVSMAGSWVFSLIGSLAPNWLVFAVCKFFSAFFASATNAVVYALLGECTPRAHRNKLVLLISSGLMFAQGILAMIGYPCLRSEFSYELLGLTYRPWRMLSQVYGLASLAALVATYFFLHESPKFHISLGREEESLQVLRAIFSANTGRRPEEYPVKSLLFLESTNFNAKAGLFRSMWLQTAPLFQGKLLKNTLIITYIVIVIYSIPPSFMMWMPTIANAYGRALELGHTEGQTFCELLTAQLEQDTHATAVAASSNSTVTLSCNDRVEDMAFITIFAFSTLLCVLNTINSFLIKWVGKRNIVIGFHLLAGICGLVLNSIHNVIASIFVFFAFQVNLVTMGVATGFTVEVYPTYLRAMAVCLTMMVGRGASFVCINFIGLLMKNHCQTTFYGFGGLVLSGAFVALLLPSDQKKGAPEQDTVKKSPLPE